MGWRGLGGRQGCGGRSWFEERGWGRGLGPEPSSCLFGPLKWPGYWGTRDYRERAPFSGNFTVPTSSGPPRIPSCLALDLCGWVGLSSLKTGPVCVTFCLLPRVATSCHIAGTWAQVQSSRVTKAWCFLDSARGRCQPGATHGGSSSLPVPSGLGAQASPRPGPWRCRSTSGLLWHLQGGPPSSYCLLLLFFPLSYSILKNTLSLLALGLKDAVGWRGQDPTLAASGSL